MKILFFCLLGCLIGYWFGYEVAHSRIAKECEKLGGFFVGNKVFSCTKIKEDLPRLPNQGYQPIKTDNRPPMPPNPKT